MAGKSDVKSLFKAAQAQRGPSTTKLSKEQIRQLRAQKVQQTSVNGSIGSNRQTAGVSSASGRQQVAGSVPDAELMPPPPPRLAATPSSGAVEAPSSNNTGAVQGSVPAGFFDYDDAEEEPAVSTSGEGQVSRSTAPAVSPAPAPRPDAHKRTQAAAATTTTTGGPPHLPKDFFASAEAAAKARGEAPPKKKTVKEEMNDFMSAISSDLAQVSKREEEEAEAAANEKEEREAFEHALRLKQVEELRAKAAIRAARQAKGDAARDQPPRKKIKLLEDVLLGVGDDESDDEEDEEVVVDWRAKTIQ